MRKNTENTMRNADVAKSVNAIIAKSQLAQRYTIAFNENVDKSNRVAIFNESVESAKQIVSTMNLQSDFMQAVARTTVWLDNTQIVIFIGAVFTVYASQSQLDSKAEFNKLFNESIDKKYNERKLKNKTITALTETRHTFNSVDDFKSFFELFSQLVNDRLTAQQTETADSTAETAKETDSTAQQTAKQSKAKQSKSKAKQSKTDLSKVSAETIAEMTKEIIESEKKHA